MDCPQLDFGGPKLDLRLQVVSAGGRPPDGAPWRGADGAGGRCAMERGADGAAAPSSPARFGRGKVSSTLPGGGSGPSGDGSGPAWSRARGGGRVAAVVAAAVSLGVGL